jgi:23S rRNA (uracil1939-C5)-methyltransferase
MKLTIDKLIYGGQGIATLPAEAGERAGMRAFVPFTLPGEVVEAEITSVHRGYCDAQLTRVLEASPARVAAACPCFGPCGGCQLQHAEYALQVESKRAILEESLRRAGVRDLPEIAALTGAPFGYRNRVRVVVQAQPHAAVGYRRAKSHDIVVIDACPIAHPRISACVQQLAAMAQAGKLPPELREAEIFVNHDASAMILGLQADRLAGDGRLAFETFLLALAATLPELQGATVFPAGESAAREPMLQWGRPELRYRVDGRELRVSAGSFFQVNGTLLDAFVGAVTEGHRGSLAWDLYAGVGLFSVALTEKFARVEAVEGSPAAFADLRSNLQGRAAHAHQAATLNFLRAHARNAARRRPDLIVLDPPRAGLGSAVCRPLAQIGPPSIVYVSCDPATMGRDVLNLVQSGYRIRTLQLVDMFPQTSHMEAIATFTLQ